CILYDIEDVSVHRNVSLDVPRRFSSHFLLLTQRLSFHTAKYVLGLPQYPFSFWCTETVTVLHLVAQVFLRPKCQGVYDLKYASRKHPTRGNPRMRPVCVLASSILKNGVDNVASAEPYIQRRVPPPRFAVWDRVPKILHSGIIVNCTEPS
ncbi:unnamed protein product, partial [Scytosiphon promiscuus]